MGNLCICKKKISVKFWCLSVIPGDLCATDITMGDEDRKTLMMMVKDGSLTTEQAMAMVSVGFSFVKFPKKKNIFFFIFFQFILEKNLVGQRLYFFDESLEIGDMERNYTCIPFDIL